MNLGELKAIPDPVLGWTNKSSSYNEDGYTTIEYGVRKNFDESAPCSALVPAAKIGHPAKGAIWLKVNGQVKQQATLNHMIWSVAEQISRLSEAFELFPGDIIYSGTPENVGPVVKGDVIECHVDGLPELSVKIV